MADETTTGAKTEVLISDAEVDKRKKMIKIAIIVVIIAALGWVVWKYVLKK